MSVKQPEEIDRWPLRRAIAFWIGLSALMWLVIIGVAQLVGGGWML